MSFLPCLAARSSTLPSPPSLPLPPLALAPPLVFREMITVVGFVASSCCVTSRLYTPCRSTTLGPGSPSITAGPHTRKSEPYSRWPILATLLSMTAARREEGSPAASRNWLPACAAKRKLSERLEERLSLEWQRGAGGGGRKNGHTGHLWHCVNLQKTR